MAAQLPLVVDAEKLPVSDSSSQSQIARSSQDSPETPGSPAPEPALPPKGYAVSADEKEPDDPTEDHG